MLLSQTGSSRLEYHARVQVQKQSETNQPVPFKVRIILLALQSLETARWAL